MPRSAHSGRNVSERSLLEQGVPACQEEQVGVGLPGECLERRGLVHARPDRADDALLAEFDQGGECAGQRLGHMVVRVVHVDDVQPVLPEPGQALLDRGQHAVAAVVVDRGDIGSALVERQAVGTEVVRVGRGVGAQQPADLGGQHVLVAGPPGQPGPEPHLAQAEAVLRCCVVEPDSAGPRPHRRRRCAWTSETSSYMPPIAVAPNPSAVTFRPVRPSLTTAP